MYFNGQQVRCSLDGISVSCASALQSLESGSAIPAGLPAGAQFTSHGLGIYTVQQFAGYTLGFSNGSTQWAGWDFEGAVGQMEGGEALIRNWYLDSYFFGNSWGAQHQPQQSSPPKDIVPVPDAKTMRASIEDRLKSNGGKCAQFLDSVRTELGVKETFLELFDRLVKQGGDVRLDPKRGGGSGVYPYEKRNIGVGGVTDRVERYTNVVIHELIHFAGGGEGHERYARAGFSSLTSEQQAQFALPTKKDRLKGDDMDDTYSRYFSRLMNCFCPPF